MTGYSGLIRITMTMIALIAIWGLGFLGIFPLTDTPTIARALMIVFGLVLALGLLPGLYLNKWIGWLASRSGQATKAGLLWATLGAPIVFAGLFFWYAAAERRYLEWSREHAPVAPASWGPFVFCFGTGLLCLVTFLLNGLAVLSLRRNAVAPSPPAPTER
jgi:hypothetical protein